ncbi:hypothetical protein AYI70_g10509 [Smittium culicis]|uniref:Uncharacterized protein n=1 Tax=Smittium culicis TaxID=133412 RepID=A0A1R1X678_9FUNG|nr:hypothetical protein AYI70_g10509 [Smittium culicis]
MVSSSQRNNYWRKTKGLEEECLKPIARMRIYDLWKRNYNFLCTNTFDNTNGNYVSESRNTVWAFHLEYK